MHGGLAQRHTQRAPGGSPSASLDRQSPYRLAPQHRAEPEKLGCAPGPPIFFLLPVTHFDYLWSSEQLTVTIPQRLPGRDLKCSCHSPGPSLGSRLVGGSGLSASMHVCDLFAFLSRILISGVLTPGSTSWKRISALLGKETAHVSVSVQIQGRPYSLPPRRLSAPCWRSRGLLHGQVSDPSVGCAWAEMLL